MDIFKLAERSMHMDDAAWRRHANPLSVYSRFTCLPLIVLAIWSHHWIGWWVLALLAMALLWTWANPRLFPEPARWDRWASRGVMGERVFLDHRDMLPPHHRRAATLLTIGSITGLPVMVYGVWALDVAATLLGLLVTMICKTWFVDRMVWILQDWQSAGHALPRGMD